MTEEQVRNLARMKVGMPVDTNERRLRERIADKLVAIEDDLATLVHTGVASARELALFTMIQESREASSGWRILL